jgi:serine phosphatase RsbU (regulator of sigma subunit)
MFTDVYRFDTEKIDYSKYSDEDQVLVQIFSGESGEKLKLVSAEISNRLPFATVIGSTTDGEIYNGEVLTKSTVVSVSVFFGTTIKSTAVDGESSYSNGQIIARRLIRNDTKLLILFSDGLQTNGEDLLKGVEKIAPSIPVSGGMAGDNSLFEKTSVTLNGTLFNSGVVGVALNSNILNVLTDYNFNWRPIGKRLKVTKAYKNIVYTINHIEAGQVYKKYLGESVYNRLPATGVEFPLIINKGGVNIARAIMSIDREDDSLTFAGNIRVGDRVQFGIGNIAMILQESIGNSKLLQNNGVESFFLYSCMARRRLMPDEIESETLPFNDIAPTVGFFTNGEFFHRNEKNELLNQTLTYVGLSEETKIDQPKQLSRISSKKNNDSFFTLQALSHLVDVSTEELEQTQTALQESIHYSSTIQKFILPKKESFNSFFSDYFIYWKPRDMVGGDLYSLEIYSESKALLMVFDCVGHGVYGAFITMLVKAVEKSIISEKIESTSEILERFNREIKSIIQDGIDIGFDGGVLFIDKESRKIRYSGASTSLFIGDCETIQEVRGDRTSVGNRFSNSDFSFKESEVEYKDGLQLYITTDGFLDQTGGEHGFSYGRKRFKETLQTALKYNFAIQRTMLRKSLRQYQKGSSAIDDRTVIGVKI